jgi:hypothetical protein
MRRWRSLWEDHRLEMKRREEEEEEEEEEIGR